MLENDQIDSPNHQKDRLWNLIPRAIRGILLWARDSWEETMVILPSNVRYALRYRGAQLNPQDWISLLEEKYGFLWVYVCLKFYEKDIEKLHTHLQVIFQGVKDGKSFHQYTQALREDVGKIQNNAQILWTKSSQVSRNWFTPMCDGIAKVFNWGKKEGIPILVAFSGLLWIKGIIQDMHSGEVFYIFFPKNSSEKSFLQVTCSGEIIHIARLHEWQLRDFFHDKDIVMIDDTQKTWATFDQAERKVRRFCGPKSITKKSLVTVSKDLF